MGGLSSFIDTVATVGTFGLYNPGADDAAQAQADAQRAAINSQNRLTDKQIDLYNETRDSNIGYANLLTNKQRGAMQDQYNSMLAQISGNQNLSDNNLQNQQDLFSSLAGNVDVDLDALTQMYNRFNSTPRLSTSRNFNPDVLGGADTLQAASVGNNHIGSQSITPDTLGANHINATSINANHINPDQFNFNLERDKGYQFARDEALNGVINAYSGGMGLSGAAAKALQNRASGVANAYANDAFNRQAQQSQINQNNKFNAFDRNEASRLNANNFNEGSRLGAYDRNEASRLNAFNANQANNFAAFDRNQASQFGAFDRNQASDFGAFDRNEASRLNAANYNRGNEVQTFDINNTNALNAHNVNEANRLNTFNTNLGAFLSQMGAQNNILNTRLNTGLSGLSNLSNAYNNYANTSTGNNLNLANIIPDLSATYGTQLNAITGANNSFQNSTGNSLINQGANLSQYHQNMGDINAANAVAPVNSFLNFLNTGANVASAVYKPKVGG